MDFLPYTEFQGLSSINVTIVLSSFISNPLPHSCVLPNDVIFTSTLKIVLLHVHNSSAIAVPNEHENVMKLIYFLCNTSIQGSDAKM